MNPPTKREREKPQIEEAVLAGPTKVGSFEMPVDMYDAVKAFALKNKLHVKEAFTLILVTGFDALTGDSLKPVAKVSFPAAFDWIANNMSWIEAKRKRYQEILKETKDKIKVEMD